MSSRVNDWVLAGTSGESSVPGAADSRPIPNARMTKTTVISRYLLRMM